MTEAKLKRETKRRRPSEEKANKAVETFLEAVLGDVPDFTLVEDGDATSAPGKCGWAFWVLHADTTSYVHEDLSIEWYGTRWQKGDPLDHEGEIEERDPSTLGDDAKPAPSGDPDPVACAPDPGVVEGVDQDCDGEDDRADGDEPDTDEEFVKVMRDIEEIDEDGDLVRAWSWTGDPLLSSYGRAAAAKKAAERYYGQSLLWWEERPGYWMAARPFIRMPDSLRSEPDDNDCDAADPDGDGLADSEGVDYRTDDCDDTTPCWCGETDPLFDDEGLDATCDGSGTLICHCGGDPCVCHHHGETECPGCEHCAELEGDDDGPFEDGDENAPGWCDRCSPDPCSCDDEED